MGNPNVAPEASFVPAPENVWLNEQQAADLTARFLSVIDTIPNRVQSFLNFALGDTNGDSFMRRFWHNVALVVYTNPLEPTIGAGQIDFIVKQALDINSSVHAVSKADPKVLQATKNTDLIGYFAPTHGDNARFIDFANVPLGYALVQRRAKVASLGEYESYTYTQYAFIPLRATPQEAEDIMMRTGITVCEGGNHMNLEHYFVPNDVMQGVQTINRMYLHQRIEHGHVSHRSE